MEHPQEYLTVGEVAKKMKVTVRTLQYYDRMGLLSPSSKSEGGRRLYTARDLVRLHQILSLKSLGFSLKDIGERLIPLNTPASVAQALANQAASLKREIAALRESLVQIEALRSEVLQMQSVDFNKYADIIVNLQMKNEFYHLIKYFDDDTLAHIRNRFDKESGLSFIHRFQRLCDTALQLEKDGTPPQSEEAQRLAEEFWNMVSEFTNGDLSMLPKLVEAAKLDGDSTGYKERLASVNRYLAPALEMYFSKRGINPFGGSTT